MKILIIGSKGFIGGHLENYLLSKGYNVWGCDVVTDHNRPKYSNLTIHGFDLVFKSKKYDMCINCSGSANIPESVSHPLNDFYSNVFVVSKILNAIKEHNSKCKFINLSSAAVYGNQQQIPINEKQELNPVSPYGFHKKQAEEICGYYYSLFGIRTCSIRIFSAYGEGLKKQLFWDLNVKSKKSKSIVTIHGTGNESRDYIHIKDLVLQLEIGLINAPFRGEKINSANGVEIKISDAVRCFLKNKIWKGNIRYNNRTRKGDPINWCADISKMKNWGYTQKYNLENGIKNYVRWIKDQKLD